MTSFIDNSNSSNRPLDDGTSFIGSPGNTNKYQGSLITCKTDQNAVLTVEWSDDLEHWDFSSSHAILADVAFKTLEQNLGTFIKVSLENDSGSDQTYLRLITRFVNDVPDAIVDTYTSTSLWDDQLIVNTNFTTTVDLINTNGNIDLFGSVSDAGTLDIQVSDDDVAWFNAYQINATTACDFHARLETACRFLRCVYSGLDNTITLNVNAK
jgi:hypothetical protein